VSKGDPILAIRRILVALDSSPHSLAALQAAVDLAARMDAELLGLFVEDTALMRLAEVPYTREVLYFSVAGVPLTPASMESKLKAQSEQIRRALAAAAQHAHVAWSFRAVRGEVASEVLAAATEADLLALGRGGWSVGCRVRAGSTALEMAASTIPVLLLPRDKVPEKAHLVVYYDGSAAAQRGLQAAAELARTGMDGITVLAGSGNHFEMELIEEALSDGGEIEIRHRVFDPASKKSLLDALAAERNGILVLGSRELLTKLPPLETFLCEMEMPLLLLGDGANPEAG